MGKFYTSNEILDEVNKHLYLSKRMCSHTFTCGMQLTDNTFLLGTSGNSLMFYMVIEEQIGFL